MKLLRSKFGTFLFGVIFNGQAIILILIGSLSNHLYYIRKKKLIECIDCQYSEVKVKLYEENGFFEKKNPLLIKTVYLSYI